MVHNKGRGGNRGAGFTLCAKQRSQVTPEAEGDGEGKVADMFMFVDAGLLPPDAIVWFGSSRNFSVPGRYVIRSSGCLTTVPAPCGWNTIPGTTVTFTIK